jgi:periplasmic protein TonB
MKTDAILKADVLDIIFENRNKSYGAYTLRKFYNNRLYKALAVMFGFVLLLSSFTLFKGKSKITGDIFNKDSAFIVRQLNMEDKKPLAPKVNTSPVSATPRTPVPMNNYSHVKITDNPKVQPIKTLDPNAIIGDRDIKIPDGVGSPIPIQMHVSSGGGGGTDTAKAIVKPIIDKNVIVDAPEIMPTYPGGMEALRKFLQINLQNPQDLNEGESVSVRIKFVVGYDGALKGFETILDGGTAFNNEVIRVLKKMKPWNPGKSKGENVSVYYTIPVTFTTSE